MKISWRDRLIRLVTYRRARAYALVLVLLYLVAWVDVVFVQGSPPLNSAGSPLAGDFIAFQAAGRLVLTGHAAQMYDHAAIVATQDALLGNRVPGFYDAFRNPPFYALLYAPLGWLDLLSGFAVWSLLSLGFLALSLKLLLDEHPPLRARWFGVLVFVIAFPPVYFGLIDGENATLSLLLYALIFRAFPRRQDRSLGVWVALGLFKPQLFFVWPLVLVVSRRWLALFSYVVTTMALLSLSLVLVGADGLQAWVRILLEPEGGNAVVNGWRMVSAKSFFDALLPGYGNVSVALYVLAGLGLMVGLWRIWTQKDVDLPTACVLTTVVALLVDPHLVDYDLTVLVVAGVIAAPLVPKLIWVILPLYAVTLLRAQIPLGDTASLQLSPLLLAACAVGVWRQRLREPGPESPESFIPTQTLVGQLTPRSPE